MHSRLPNSNMKACRVIVTGRVQGVGFRAFTRRHAMLLGLRGVVSNQSDGSVNAYIEGNTERVQQMLHLLNQGPSLARVEKVQVTPVEPRGDYKTFEVTLGY